MAEWFDVGVRMVDGEGTCEREGLMGGGRVAWVVRGWVMGSTE